MNKEEEVSSLVPGEYWITTNGVTIPTAHNTKDNAIAWSQGDYVLIHVREILDEE